MYGCRMKRPLTFLLALLCCSCADAPEHDPEVERVRAHLERVERDLWSNSQLDLTPEQWAARESVLEDLRRYIEAEAYPINDRHDRMTPIFIDPLGNRCAMAALIEASGHGELVQRVARDHNLAYIDDLGGDAELRDWLQSFGLTLDEAATIQPGYTPPPDSMTWDWTAGVLGSALFGNTTALSGGVRVGARGIATNMDDACDHCVYRSMALMLEGMRTSLSDVGATSQFAALISRTVDGRPNQHEVYIIGGPQISLDENDEPGTGFGGKLGVGYTKMILPNGWLFGEFMASARNAPKGARVHAGLELGLRW